VQSLNDGFVKTAYFNSTDAKATITVSNDAISTNSLPVDISGRPNIIGFDWWQFARGKGIEDRVLRGISPGKQKLN
jgi:hypothetical protein